MEKTCNVCVGRTTGSVGRCVLNVALLVSFAVTVMVPLTGIVVHKLASVLFLLLCAVHTVVYRKRLKAKWIGLLALVLVAFVSGVLGMILEETPVVLAFHEAVSIGSVFFLAIHIFSFHRKLWKR